MALGLCSLLKEALYATKSANYDNSTLMMPSFNHKFVCLRMSCRILTMPTYRGNNEHAYRRRRSRCAWTVAVKLILVLKIVLNLNLKLKPRAEYKITMT